jgi:recombination protein RecA
MPPAKAAKKATKKPAARAAQKKAAKKASAARGKTAAKKSAKKATDALDKFNERFEKAFGPNTIMTAADKPPYEVIPTGSPLTDDAMVVGGYVIGRITEVWGPDALGKTSFVLCGAAEAQAMFPDKLVAFLDVEHTFDEGLARGMGVDTKRMKWIKATSAELVADQMKMIIQSGLFSMVILDSIGAMIPEAEKEKDADEAVVANQAKIVTRMVKIAAAECDKPGQEIAVVLINQVRANIGYGADTTTGGGFALKHVSTHKLKFKRTGTSPYNYVIGGEKIVVGHELSIEVERNKVGPPKRKSTINLMNQPSVRYGDRGLNKPDETTTLGLMRKFIKQRGGYYDIPTVDGTVTVTGRDKIVEFYRDNPAEMDNTRNACLAMVKELVVVGHDAQITNEDLNEVEALERELADMVANSEVLQEVAAEVAPDLIDRLDNLKNLDD